MSGHLIFSNDKLGLTGVWYDVPVPETEELPAHYGLTEKERRQMLSRDAALRMENDQFENRHKSKWNRRRHYPNDERKDDTADTNNQVA